VNKLIFFAFVFLLGCSSVTYKEKLSEGENHNDVAMWLRVNFQYERNVTGLKDADKVI